MHSDVSAGDDDAPSNAGRAGRATVSEADRYCFTMHEAFPNDFPATAEVGGTSLHSMPLVFVPTQDAPHLRARMHVCA